MDKRQVWGNVFKKDCIKELRFDTDLYVGEDSLFFAQAVKNSHKLIFLPNQYYNYVIYSGSALHGIFNEKKYTEVIAWKRVTEVFDDNQCIHKSACAAYGLSLIHIWQRPKGMVIIMRQMKAVIFHGMILPTRFSDRQDMRQKSYRLQRQSMGRVKRQDLLTVVWTRVN